VNQLHSLCEFVFLSSTNLLCCEHYNLIYIYTRIIIECQYKRTKPKQILSVVAFHSAAQTQLALEKSNIFIAIYSSAENIKRGARRLQDRSLIYCLLTVCASYDEVFSS
jgi:hypothetical protein